MSENLWLCHSLFLDFTSIFASHEGCVRFELCSSGARYCLAVAEGTAGVVIQSLFLWFGLLSSSLVVMQILGAVSYCSFSKMAQAWDRITNSKSVEA